MDAEKERKYKAALQSAKEQILALQARAAPLSEPVAVIGMACLFPGGAGGDVETPEDFHRRLMDGMDAVRPVPPERDRQGQPSPSPAEGSLPPGLKQAALLDRDPYAFDTSFFGIAPAEARMTDPQHRLMLELAQRALWDAGLPKGSEPGGDVGVFCGKSGTDYLFDVLGTGALSAGDPYVLTGNMHSALPGRVSYFFDWNGPCLSYEGACATALVATLAAVQSLRRGECALALAGAVNLLAGPTASHWLNAMQALAPDGRCKAFGADADGFGRGEGGGALVLQRLSDARRDGNRIHALILGGAVGSDGRSRNFTAPSAKGQRHVIRRALDDARIDPGAVAFVETHGTGTPIGDPIEAESLAAVYGPRARPLRIGSVKSNVAHLESAAGMAALIKTIMAVRSGVIPKTLHAERPNPLLELERSGLALCRETAPWPDGYERRIAGVSGFAITGVLAHLLLAEPPPADSLRQRTPSAGPRLLALVARGEAEMRMQVQDARAALDSGLSFASLCDAAGNARPQDKPGQEARDSALFPERFALCATESEAAAALDAVLAGKKQRAAFRGRREKQTPPILFLYGGQGSQLHGMGRDLYAAFPEFSAVIDRCEALAAPRLGHSLIEVMFADNDARLHQTRVTQPAIYSYQAALTALLKSRGVTPSVVLGHSIGEYAAAQAAGVLEVEEGLEIALERGTLAQTMARPGGMAAVLGGEAEIATLIADIADLSIAAINMDDSVTIAGEVSALAVALDRLSAHGIEYRPMPVSHAFHCPLIDPVLPGFGAFLKGRRFASPRLAFLSGCTGEVLADGVDWPAYFVRQMRDPVRFAAAVRAAPASLFLEIGAGPTLTGFGRQIRPEAQWLFAQNGAAVDGFAQERFLALALARLYSLGVPLDHRWLAADPWRPEAAPMPVFHRIVCAPETGGQAPASGTVLEREQAGAQMPISPESSPRLQALIREQDEAVARIRALQQRFLGQS
ncbi:MAG: type I polyketide synthase [Rhodospirillaceae bacterium]|nr:type I polyketide synthase [Rhodospirillaceae bacterium]